MTTQTQNKDKEKGFAKDPQRASEAGKKGGSMSGGNFKNDPERAAEAGKKGGEHSHGGHKSE